MGGLGGVFWAVLGGPGRSWDVLGQSWGVLEWSWRILGAPRAVLGGSWASLGGVLGGLWAVLEASWGAIWGCLGASWALLQASWGVLEVSWCRFHVDGILRSIFIEFYVNLSISRTRGKGLWYYKNSSSEPSGYFHRKLIQDAILVPTCPHMASQNAPKTRLGGVLGPLGPVLGASWPVLEASWALLEASWPILAPSWRILEASWGVLEASWASKSHGMRVVPLGPGPGAGSQRPLLRIIQI